MDNKLRAINKLRNDFERYVARRFDHPGRSRNTRQAARHGASQLQHGHRVFGYT
jgi:hypothetical protein